MELLDNPLRVLGYLRDRQRKFGQNTLKAIGVGVIATPVVGQAHPLLGVANIGVCLFATVANAQEWDEFTALADHLEENILDELYSDITEV